MKSRAQLEEIARGIVKDCNELPRMDKTAQERKAETIEVIANALEAVQREALNSALPSKEELRIWALSVFQVKYAGFPNPEGVYDWIRDNMRPTNERSELPAPQRLSDEELGKLAYEYSRSDYFPIHETLAKHTAYEAGQRAAENRLLGEEIREGK
jgi:hypothetical protein